MRMAGWGGDSFMRRMKLGPYPPCLEDMEVCTIAKRVDETVKRLSLKGTPVFQRASGNERAIRDSRIARLRRMAIEKGEYKAI